MIEFSLTSCLVGGVVYIANLRTRVIRLAILCTGGEHDFLMIIEHIHKGHPLGHRRPARVSARARNSADNGSARTMEGPSGADNIRLLHEEKTSFLLSLVRIGVCRQECPHEASRLTWLRARQLIQRNVRIDI